MICTTLQHEDCSVVCRLAKQTEDQELLTYQVVSPDGKIVKTTPIPTSRGQMMHDFGITKNFAVFVEQALVFDPATMFKSDTVPITLDRKAQCRCGSPTLPVMILRSRDGAVTMHFLVAALRIICLISYDFLSVAM